MEPGETESVSMKRALPSLKKLRMVVGLSTVTEPRELPASTGPPRGPGSTWENAWIGTNSKQSRTAPTTRRITADLLPKRLDDRTTGMTADTAASHRMYET